MTTRRDGVKSRQAEVLREIEAAWRRDGRAPTIREIGAAVHISAPSHVEYVLRKLEEQGYITRDRGARGIRLAQTPGVPIVGRIAAGEPLDLFEDVHHEQLDLGAHARAADGEGEYALMVRGNSMIDDHIFDGDYVLVRPADDAVNGAIVVALHHDATTVAGAATVKRFYRELSYRRVRLQPANDAVEPILTPAAKWDSEWKIRGIVTAVYRPYHL